jgi:hypothetical protein
MRVTHREETEAARTLAWRRAQLANAGFSLPLAARLAGDVRYDLHALIELTERGCDPELAVRILAPLEAGGGAA